MNEERLAELEQLASEASSGPWSVGQFWIGDLCLHRVYSFEAEPIADLRYLHDAAFIAAARAAVPALVAEVRRLRAENDLLRPKVAVEDPALSDFDPEDYQ